MERAMPATEELVETVRNPRWQIAAVLAALVIALVAAFGGFRQAPAKPIPQYPVGARVVTAALAVTVQRAWLDSRSPQGYRDSILRTHYLVLDALVENLTDKSNSWYLGDDLRFLPAGNFTQAIRSDSAYLADDKTYLNRLQPHMPTHVLLSWKISAESSLPSPLHFGLSGRRFVAKTYLTTESGWLPDGPAAIISVPLEDRRGNATTPPR